MPYFTLLDFLFIFYFLLFIILQFRESWSHSCDLKKFEYLLLFKN